MFKKTGILKYGIKKLTVGIASITIGAIIFLGSNAQASDNEIKETVNPVSVEKVDSTLAPKENKKENTEVVEKNKNIEITKNETDSNLVKAQEKPSTSEKTLNVFDKRTTDSTNIKDLLVNIIKNNEKTVESEKDKEVIVENIKPGVQIISRLTSDYAEAISKGYIGLEGGKYDSLIYKNAVLNPDGDDDGDGILNKDELYIYKKDGRTYLGYDVHPKLADTDGDGQNDKEDKDKLIWNISARDMALLMNLVYEKDDQIKSILDPNTNVASLKKKEFQFMHNELAPYWTVKKIFHQDNGLDAVLFETKANYPFLKNSTIQVLAIQGTNVKQSGDMRADAALVLGNESNQSIATKDLIKALKNDKSITNLYITGHSLGGYLTLRATAQAEKDKMEAFKGSYTFNAPKIYSGLFNFFGGGEMKKESDLTDKLAISGKITNYYTDNDNVIPGFLQPKYVKSIGKSAGQHSSTSYFESRINSHKDFNFGKRQGVDGVGYIDPNLKKLKIVSPEKGTLSSTFLPILIDKKPVSIMMGESLKDKDIFDKIDKTKLPVNISLSLLEKVDLSTLGNKNAKVKVLYLDDNTTNEIDVPVLVNEANKAQLNSVVNAAQNLVDAIVELNDKTEKSAALYKESKVVLSNKLKDAEEVINNKLASINTVTAITKEIANLGLDLIAKKEALELLDYAKYDPQLKENKVNYVKQGENLNLLEVIQKIATTGLPAETKLEVESISNFGNIGRVNVVVKVTYPDKTIDRVVVPYEIYTSEKGESLVQEALPEYITEAEKYTPELITADTVKVRQDEKLSIDTILKAVNTEKLPKNVVYELVEDKLSTLGENFVTVKVIYSDKTEDIIKVPVFVYTDSKGEGAVQPALEEYPEDKIPSDLLINGDVQVDFGNAELKGLNLGVTEIDDVNVVENIKTKLGEVISVRILDLKILKKGKIENLEKERTVRIALSDSGANDVNVYHVLENGILVKLASKIVNGNIEFKINHFSMFAVVGRVVSNVVPKIEIAKTNSNINEPVLDNKQRPKNTAIKKLPNTGIDNTKTTGIIGMTLLIGAALVRKKLK